MPQDLIAGLQHFRNTDLARYRELYERLADEGQHPRVLFISCSDSRIVPNLLTGTGPGDLFIVRTIGNILAPTGDAAAGDATAGGAASPEPTLAAVEFAVTVLGVREIVVCGHSKCGAMQALYDGVPEGLTQLAAWVEQARPAVLDPERLASVDIEERNELTTKRNVLLSLDRLAAHPLVAEGRRSKELILHGWYYDIATSAVTVFDPEHRTFVEPEALLDQ
jgi:carbonic anhydrase